ncbi:MAG: VOC family protein [Planctomycetaceae bacterium]|nr:VOC family protein [Planctomycetaceae bacterium]
MTTPVRPIPQGYHSITPYLLIRGASDAIEFYKRAFGAVEILRLQAPDGTVGHAEIRIGDSHVMMADEVAEMDYLGPQSRGGTTVSLLLYTDDVDALFAKALEAGATELKPLCDQFYGDRSGTVTDPWGHIWTVATHIEDLTPDEINQRFVELFGE